jgi:hypothetical protein
MRFMNLTTFYDFIQVQLIRRRHYTKDDYLIHIIYYKIDHIYFVTMAGAFVVDGELELLLKLKGAGDGVRHQLI